MARADTALASEFCQSIARPTRSVPSRPGRLWLAAVSSMDRAREGLLVAAVLIFAANASAGQLQQQQIGIGATLATSDAQAKIPLPPRRPSTERRRKSEQPKPKTAKRSPPAATTVNTWVIFGFTEGADTGQKDERAIYYDAVVRFSRRERGLAGWRASLGYAYSISDRLTVWGAGSASHQRTSAAAGRSNGEVSVGSVGDSVIPDTSYFGAVAGWKYRILPRDSNSVGLSIQIEPYWDRAVARAATTEQTFGSDFRLIIDKALLPDRLFGALNFAYQPEAGVHRGGGVESSSQFEAAGAISARVADKLFIGAEIRYLKSHGGYFFNQNVGWSLFAGPTLQLLLGDSGYLGLAWSLQLVGKATEEPTGVLDLVNYERQQIRVKWGVGF